MSPISSVTISNSNLFLILLNKIIRYWCLKKNKNTLWYLILRNNNSNFYHSLLLILQISPLPLAQDATVLDCARNAKQGHLTAYSWGNDSHLFGRNIHACSVLASPCNTHDFQLAFRCRTACLRSPTFALAFHLERRPPSEGADHGRLLPFAGGERLTGLTQLALGCKCMPRVTHAY